MRRTPPRRAPAQGTGPQDGSPAPALLAGGNPRIARGYGETPVQAYIAAMPDWKRAAGQRIDALVTHAVPGVQKAVKWNSPLYGMDGKTWFLGLHRFTKHVRRAFFRGGAVSPLPPGASKRKDVRYLDIRETDDIGEALLAGWLRQASALPGERV